MAFFELINHSPMPSSPRPTTTWPCFCITVLPSQNPGRTLIIRGRR